MIHIAGNYPVSISGNQTLSSGKPQSNPDASNADRFQNVLRQKVSQSEIQTDQTLKFSRHANERLADRNITLTQGQVARLQEGVDQARQKGISESLVMLDNLSFIVNIKNETVVTALDNQSSDQKIFTNIDGAVIV